MLLFLLLFIKQGELFSGIVVDESTWSLGKAKVCSLCKCT